MNSNENQRDEPTPMDIIKQRAAGTISTEEMLQRLRSYHYTSYLPAVDDWDPLAIFALPRGTARQLGEAFDLGLLSESEHDSLVTDPTIQVTIVRAPSQREAE